MCGIAGICHLNQTPVSSEVLKRMTDIMAYRGPDGEGQWANGPVGFGHRRLSIIDLSDAGAQPMMDDRGQLVLTYNGEIYNFQELREELQKFGHRFKSRTDTEVILYAYRQWGPHCVERFNGMFAFALWDVKQRTLFLARDRYGVKPLYWYFRKPIFAFASEIKALLTHPDIRPNVCYPALDEYFTFQNTFSDLTLFEGVRLLPPGCTMTLSLNTTATPSIHRYWDFSASPADGSNESAYTEQVYDYFVKGTHRQLVSDVPVGSYLSGGMDSGSITAVAVRSLPRLTTFTCGFDLSSASGLELGFDERAKAEVLSNLYKTEHYEVVAHAGDMEWALPKLIWHLEDLRIGQSYPNYLVARLASKFVKVVLSGAGGDELFAGYPWRYYRGIDSQSRPDYLKKYYSFWQRLVPDEEKNQLFNEKTRSRNQGHSSFDSFCAVFDGWKGSFQSPEDYIQASLYFELKTFLHGLLVVEDKLSMAHSLETRVPFLDNELVDFALRIPVKHKLRNLHNGNRIDENQIGKRHLAEKEWTDGKAILRTAMSRLIPAAVTERVKQGFSAPDASWFRGESIDYVNRLLRSSEARLYEFLNPVYVHKRLDEHVQGKRNHRLFIWSLISFEWWLKQFFK